MRLKQIRDILLLSAALILSASLVSCGTHKKASTTATNSTYRPVPTPPQTIDIASITSPATASLLTEASSWLGTCYAYGGNDRNGVDCSGFVLKVFDNALNIKLPRSSDQQQQFCISIPRTDLQQGDLVFFTARSGGTVGHVGIYIGNGNMIHASSSKGVIISSLDQQYYLTNFYGAGRVDRFQAMLLNEKPVLKPQPKSPDIMASATSAPQQPAESTLENTDAFFD